MKGTMNKPVFINVDTSKWFGWITELPDSSKISFVTCTHDGIFYKATPTNPKSDPVRVATVIPFRRKV